jgi:hypothetical protein
MHVNMSYGRKTPCDPGSIAMLNVRHYDAKVPREAAFSSATLYRDAPFAYRKQLKQAHERYTSRYAQEIADLNLLIDGLAPAGIVPDKVVPLQGGKTPTPDFELRLGAQTVYCECTIAGDQSSILWRFSVADLQAAVNDMLEAHDEISSAVGQRYVAFIPRIPVRPDDILAAVDEIAQFVTSEDLGAYGNRYGVRVPERYGVLAHTQTIAYTAPAEHPMILIQQPASAYGGDSEGFSEILNALRQKQVKRYDGFRPIWLVIGASDVIAPLGDIVRRIEEYQPSLEPFSRVFISTSRESFVIAQENAEHA